MQAAIWFFTDRYVVNTADPLHDEVVKIVDHIRAAGPVGEQPKPSLTITPSHVSGPAHKVLGPFTVTTNHPPATVTATGGSMFSDAAATVPIANGTDGAVGPEDLAALHGSIGRGARGYLQGHGPDRERLRLGRHTGGVSDAQHLILAKEGDLTDHGHEHRRVSRPRVAGREEDDCRSRGRVAGARGDRGGLR